MLQFYIVNNDTHESFIVHANDSTGLLHEVKKKFPMHFISIKYEVNGLITLFVSDLNIDYFSQTPKLQYRSTEYTVNMYPVVEDNISFWSKM